MNHEQYTLGKSLNKDWTRGRIKHVPHQPTLSSDKKNRRAKSACSRSNDRSSPQIPEDDSEDEVSDAVKEFRLTLQLFKRLTQQVREVNQCTNLNRVYNFKHYLANERSVSPSVRRGQLAAIMSRREIPATGAPHEPICDLGPSTLITRPCSRQECRETRTPCASTQPAPNVQSKPTTTAAAAPARRAPRPKSTSAKPADARKMLAEAASLADAKAKQLWQDEDPQFAELFGPHGSRDSEDRAGYSYHDPYPETWVDETVEGACYRGARNQDPFMLRIAEFEKLQDETVLWEKYKEEKNRVGGETAKAQATKGRQNANGSVLTATRGASRGCASSYRSQSAKTGSGISRAKSPNNKLRQSWSASKASAGINHANSQVSGDESSDSVLTFRNSGYKLGVSFVPGSMYPEARFSEKGSGSGQSGKGLNCSPRLGRNASPLLDETKKFSRRPHCESCQAKASPVRRHSCPKSAVVTSTPQALRAQYDVKASECYDIVEIARTFEPPCKAQISRAKLRPRTSVHEKAAIKGLSPGKNYFSQRRVSLSCGENMTVTGVSPLNRSTRPSTARCRSLKKTAKRR